MHVHTHICTHSHLCTQYIYIYKEFRVGGSKAKTVLYFHIAPQGVNCAILSVYRTGYAYCKEPGGFQKVFLSPFSDG